MDNSNVVDNLQTVCSLIRCAEDSACVAPGTEHIAETLGVACDMLDEIISTLGSRQGE